MTAEDAGSIYSDVRIRLDKLEADITKAVGAINGLGTKLDNSTAKSSKKVKGNLDSIGVGTIAIGVAVAGAFRGMITSFSAYEQSMANVRAVTGASAADFLILKEAASDAGETTRFSASQAADALFYLGSAGFSATQSVQSLDAVLTLAQATGADLAQTANTMAATLSQFGLEASESSRVANVFAAANRNSQASLEKLQSSMRQVGPVSGSLDISLEETTANLEALYNAGFQGEAAGTALRSILLELSSSTSVTSKKLAELGVTLTDQNGQFIGLTDSVEVLAESGIALGEVFGKETAAQMLVLADTSQKAEGNLRDLESAITDTDAAAQAAAIQTDTLSGSVDSFASKAESAGNAGIESITPFLRGLIDLAGGAISIFTKLPKPIQAVITTLGLLVGGFAIVSAGASAMGISLLTALAPVAPIVIGIGAAIAGIAGIATIIDDAARATDRLVAKNIKLNQAISDNQKAVASMFEGVTGANRANKLSEDQIKKLIDIYPTLTGKVDLYSASLEDVVKATREIDQANAAKSLRETEDAIKSVQETISRGEATFNNPFQISLLKKASAEMIAIDSKIASASRIRNDNERRSTLDLLVESKKQIQARIDNANSNIEAQKNVNQTVVKQVNDARNQLITLTAQANEQKDIISGVAFARQDAVREAETASKKIATVQGVSTRQIIKNLDAERKAQLKGVEDKKTIDAVNEVFATQNRDLQVRLSGEIAQAENEKAKQAEVNSKKLKELQDEYLTDLERINQKEKEDLKIAGNNEVLKTAIRTKAQKERIDLTEKESKDRKKIEDDLKEYLNSVSQSELDLVIESLKKQRDERIKQAEEVIKDEKQLANAIIKIRADFDKKIKQAIDDSKDNETKKARDRAIAIAKIQASLTGVEISEVEKRKNEKLNALDEEYRAYKELALDEVELARWKADQEKKIKDQANEESLKETSDLVSKEVAEVKKYSDAIGSELLSLISAIAAFSTAQNEIEKETLEERYNNNIENIDSISQAQLDALDLETQAKLEAAGVADKTALQLAESRLQTAIEEGDAEKINEAQKEVVKQQILAESNAEKIRIEEETKAQQIQIEKNYAKEKARLEYEGAMIKYEADLSSAIIGGAMGAINAFATGMTFGAASVVMAPLLTGLAIATSSLNIATIQAQKPKAPKLATGGIILPSAGGTQAIMAENGSPELALNAGQSGEALMQMFADKITKSMGGSQTGKTMAIYVVLDKQKIAEVVTEYQNGGRVEVIL